MTAIRLVLGDQLTPGIASLRDYADGDRVLMCEVHGEATYVRHHKKKIAFLFSAMRHFAAELERDGVSLDYVAFDDPQNTGTLVGEVEGAARRHGADRVVITEPGEHRLSAQFRALSGELDAAVEILEDDRFLCSVARFRRWLDGRKAPRMEHFYREMRREHAVLMQDGEPAGGQWNYDAQNRKRPDASQDVPPPFAVTPDAITREVIDLVAERFADHFGDLEPFHFAVTRDDALLALDDFVNRRLPRFGDFQDAMIEGEPWMYHSHLSLYINAGLLLPLECVRAAEAAYESGLAPLNAVEGFVRQILGWREYVRGIYFTQMPDYKQRNALDAQRALPGFYWTGDTELNCLRQCIQETKRNAYAHHIQRLMVLGNFALLCGLHPDEVNEWYLIVYADAYEWVELPNVSGMILFADGGFLASKPYAASGSYINRMSNYCRGCRFDVRSKSGPRACPFNYLYWDFLARNRERLARSPRMTMMYRNLDRMDDDALAAVRDSARQFLDELER